MRTRRVVTVHEEAVHLAQGFGPPLREIVDGGANVGKISELFLRLCPAARVHAFEPHPVMFNRLAGRLTGYGARVVLNQRALGASPGEMQLNLGHPPATSSMYEISDGWKGLYPGVELIERETVEVKTLDSYAEQRKLERIDFLKLDTQGAEHAILCGAENLLEDHRIGFMLLEVFFVPFYSGTPLAGDVFTLLSEHDYYPVKIWTEATPTRWERHADVLFSCRSKPPAR